MGKMFILNATDITLKAVLAQCCSASFFNMLYLVHTINLNTCVMDKQLNSLYSQHIE